MHERKFRMTFDTKVQYFDVSLRTGAVQTKEIIDREALCGSVSPCLLNLEVVMDNPMEFHRLEVEIVDVNDNAPAFPERESRFIIAESTLPGAHFPLSRAFDPDVGKNSLCTYSLSPNDYFTIYSKVGEHKSSALDLVLMKALDREQQPLHQLTLTAVDGGTPKSSGTAQITINVQDANDNPPVFDKEVYKVTVAENVPVGTLLIKLNATDKDEGANGDIVYSLSGSDSAAVNKLFSVDAESCEIYVRSLLDFEESRVHELQVRAEDKGPLPMRAHCSVLIEMIDLNDNAPEIRVTSISSPVREDTQPGLVIALFTVTDQDSGMNGEVRCQISNELPFVIEPKYANYFSLAVKGLLDREDRSQYNITVTAIDGGSPPLSTASTIVVSVSDVNDNPPTFSQLSYVRNMAENIVPGSQILQVSALDPDTGENARVRYSLIENNIDTVSTLSLFSVHTETGGIYALQPFDYEKLQVLQFQVEARDYGSPSLSATVNVTVFIQDVNDNPPTIFPALSGSVHSADTVLVPRSANTGYMVTKVRAIDADSGHNAWLAYELQESPNTAPFRIRVYTGEINLKHQLGESYPERLELLILVMDHGTPPRTATATLTVSLVENNPEVKPNYRHVDAEENSRTDLNSYLVISIAFISSIFILCIIVFTALKCIKARNSRELNQSEDSYPEKGNNGAYPQNQQYNLYLTAPPSEYDAETLKSKLLDQGWTTVNVNGAVTGDLLQRGSILDFNAPLMSSEPKNPNPDWRYSASLRAGVQSAVHLEESAILRGVQQVLETQWPTVSSTNTDPDGGEVSPPVGAGVNCNSWTFKYGPVNPKQPAPAIPPDFPENFIIPGSPAIISIRQDQPSSQAAEKGNFITFGKKEEAKKKKKKKKGIKSSDKKEKGNSATDNSDQ